MIAHMLEDLIRRLLILDPAQRLTAAQAGSAWAAGAVLHIILHRQCPMFWSHVLTIATHSIISTPNMYIKHDIGDSSGLRYPSAPRTFRVYGVAGSVGAPGLGFAWLPSW